MAICKKIKRKHRQVCIGDLNTQISIKSRAIDSPDGNSVDFDEDFVEVDTPWALVQTTRGSQLFGDVSIDEVTFTHIFYIRYIADLSFENWIEYNNEKYKIQDIENLDERSNFLLIKCIKKGDKDLKANFS